MRSSVALGSVHTSTARSRKKATIGLPSVTGSDCISLQRSNPLGRLLSQFTAHVGQDQIGARFGEGDRHVGAQSAAATGDDGGLPAQVEQIENGHGSAASAPTISPRR